jgi:hypothetical protein
VLQLSERECRDLFERLCCDLPSRIASLTQPSVAQ